jgi:hypothetical protein
VIRKEMTAPGPPIPFSVPVQIADRTLRFIWTVPTSSGSAPITTYELSVFSVVEQEREYKFHVQALQFLLPGNEMFYDVSGLTNGHSYTGGIRASNDGGVTWGPEASFDAQHPIAPPSFPVQHAIAYRITGNTATVTWVPPLQLPDPATAYYYVESQSNNAGDELLANRTADLNTYRLNLNGLNPASVYVARVYVKNLPGQSPAFTTNEF